MLICLPVLLATLASQNILNDERSKHFKAKQVVNFFFFLVGLFQVKKKSISESYPAFLWMGFSVVDFSAVAINSNPE